MPQARDVYTLVTTSDLAGVKQFYMRHFAAEPVFEATWFLLLNLPGGDGGGFRLAFMTPDHPSRPPGPEIFSGRGLIVTIQVDDAEAAHAELAEAGAPITYGLTHEVWGQKRFMTVDPSGLGLDIVEQVEPETGFWERYMPAD